MTHSSLENHVAKTLWCKSCLNYQNNREFFLLDFYSCGAGDTWWGHEFYQNSQENIRKNTSWIKMLVMCSFININ